MKTNFAFQNPPCDPPFAKMLVRASLRRGILRGSETLTLFRQRETNLLSESHDNSEADNNDNNDTLTTMTTFDCLSTGRDV